MRYHALFAGAGAALRSRLGAQFEGEPESHLQAAQAVVAINWGEKLGIIDQIE